jgi:hypothetical protein
MRLFGLSVAMLALAGCVPGAGPGSADEARVAVGPIASAGVLEGEYRVAEVDGIDMGALDVGYSVSVTADRIAITGSCVTTPWAYRFEGGRLVTTPIEGPTCRRVRRCRAGRPHARQWRSFRGQRPGDHAVLAISGPRR